MTIQEFKQELARHDWYYNFTDDHSVWKKGIANDRWLRIAAIDGGPEFIRAYNNECAKARSTGDILRGGYPEGEPEYILEGDVVK